MLPTSPISVDSFYSKDRRTRGVLVISDPVTIDARRNALDIHDGGSALGTIGVGAGCSFDRRGQCLLNRFHSWRSAGLQ